jgi:hypothetical protein
MGPAIFARHLRNVMVVERNHRKQVAHQPKRSTSTKHHRYTL